MEDSTIGYIRHSHVWCYGLIKGTNDTTRQMEK
jgi:hypothetical protein